ncbi:hypothetical protein SAMN04487962_12237 [Marinobacter segnicrescens]|uniref:Polysaccharide lyase n=1 Tax=Marinobacter segnicrescens TaxID=430453 RepID=A0A1I0H2H0_9GAMM|nr:hypothetical protein [Marinobacter segnicrescens]SET76993.1 hypothetical protein SAMN04487962_12237 [Marinobacter segnicrescens]
MSVISLLSKGIALTALTLPVATANETLIFDAEFDKQENWAPKVRSQRYRFEGDTGWVPDIPENKPGKFDFYYLSESWHPSDYPEKKPVVQITDDFPGYSGRRAFVMWDESYGGPGSWGADSVMTKDLGQEYDELYLELRIKFSPDWIWEDIQQGSGQSVMKLLRCRRYSGITTQNRFSFFGEDARSGSPVAIFDLKSWTTSTGNWLRPLMHIYGYSHPDYYKTEQDYFGFGSDYKTKIENGVKVNGRSLSWADVFLDGNWHTIGMYLKMDSQAGAGDGQVKVFIDGDPVIDANDVPWRRVGDESIKGWNECSLGGNINNVPFDSSERYEQWYAVDTFKIHRTLPNKPNPPSDIKIQE